MAVLIDVDFDVVAVVVLVDVLVLSCSGRC